MAKTEQESVWQGEFGRRYTERCWRTPEEADEDMRALYGIRRTEMNREFLAGIDRSAMILEVGANIGIQLLHLRRMGFRNLFGIEVQAFPFEVTQAPREGIVMLRASGFEIPFCSSSFDLVFTSGVLIHIAPDNIPRIISEIVRCSRRYVWGFEYYAQETSEVSYRGHSGLLWKADYSAEYRRLFPSLVLRKETKYKYLDNDNVDCMFLLEKNA